MTRNVYLDNAATTKLSPEVLDAMMPYLTNEYGNASSIYSLGSSAKVAVEKSREIIAKELNAEASEIFFTSGGSEADNWAIKGYSIFQKRKGKGNHIITSNIEHHAVLHTCEYLEKNGFEITYLDVDENGIVNPIDVQNAIKDTTILVTIMFANNEIGTIEPIKEIGEICKANSIAFHTDAVQAFGTIPINVKDMNIDMLSLSGHKIHGPKGVGALYLKKGIRLDNLIHGGAQERGKRATTENVAGIVGLAKATELYADNRPQRTKYISELRDYLLKEITEKIKYTKINGDLENRLPNNLNVCFEFVEGESILLSLDMLGIAASSGSACTSGSLDPSHVLLAIGLPHAIAHGSLRLTLSEDTTKEDCDYVVENLADIIENLRNMSPLYEDFIRGEK